MEGQRNTILMNTAAQNHESVDMESTTRMSQIRLEQHTKIFASMCPDEILDHYGDYETRVYYTTLMLGDVSGFTDLTEKYTKTGKGGPSKLTETLNSYIGAMVQEILSHNGDVLKFSGDAFIVMWKLQEGRIMRDLAIEAIQTACVIQKHFGTYNTDVGITLRVKLSIASGKIYFTSIGDPKMMSYYIITGKPVWDVKFAEGLCRGGDILVAPSSWQWANPNEYIYETLPDGVHTLIIACSSMWYPLRGDHISSHTEDEENHESLFLDSSSTVSAETPNKISDFETRAALMDLLGNDLPKDKFHQVDYSLRPKVIKVAKARLKDALRSYMLRPVIRSVEMDEPLEHLTEMRQVVIVFINVITSNISRRRLISLVNAAYKLVCGIVVEMQGCVNKTSLFDKDLMFLCVFGLRGYKHELESQIGLRCASKIREQLVAMRNVKCVTVGVTTGMTYCGVVGHILRREYTVIGMSVNKAARLMVAYNNKVICDRESFLHSRLEARHFILQEPRYLKGITNVGPVYEFQEQAKYKVPELIWSKYPLLGRDAEIKIFRQMLTVLVEYSNVEKATRGSRPDYNMLIIKGEPRTGKTRLLDEFAQNVPTGISCNYVSLVTTDTKAPYSLIHLIISMPLGFRITSTPKEREDKIILRLGKLRYPEYLCALNQPFNVRFTISRQYKLLTEVEKQKVLRNLLLKLMKGCFDELWVVIIDDAEYGDDESMNLFDIMTKLNMVFFIMSIGRKHGTEFRLHPTVLDRAKIVELAGIDKWYHAGLACQVLNVNGLPAELEKLIQESSSGNPGWIESYLISLLQAGGLVIVNISKKEADLMGYVLPHITMLKRFVSDTSLLAVEDYKNRMDRWQMYGTSFKDSATSLLDVEDAFDNTAIPTESDEASIAVCKITGNFSLNEIGPEMTMDVMILKLFDSLTPLDQLLLKCASVLGDTVNRQMLESLMEDETHVKEIGAAVSKLFEIRVFGCAVGDFTKDRGPVIFIRNARKSSVGNEISCGCIGIVIREELAYMPKYASCGLMQFKVTMFRDTTYRLLTENQKMELHSKALKYLRRHTRRCIACGGEQFATLLGKATVQENRTKKKGSVDIDQLLDSPQFGKTSMNKATKEPRSTITHKISSCLNTFRRVERKPTRTFSNIDFANCQCNLILMTVYTQILDHCRGIGKNDMTLTAILEFVDVCITGYNVPQARKLLSDAEVLLNKMFESDEDEEIVLLYMTSKIQILQGRCYLETGLITEAENSLDKALSGLGYKFPKLEFLIDLQSIIQLKRLKLKLTYFRNWQIGFHDEHTANYIEELSRCLAQMFDLFRTKGMKKHACLAAIWGLNAALASKRDFLILCSSYTNMMITAHIYRNIKIIPYLEEESINLCNQKKNNLEFQELKIIAEVYAGVFFSRWLRGRIIDAIRIGFISSRIASTIGSTFLKLIILPRLVHLLMISCRHSEVVTLLRELEFESRNDLDKSGYTWYYALCADAQLDTGLTVLPFQICEQYYLREGEMMINLRDPEAQKRYFTSMWLWCIRTEQWEASKVWSSRNIGTECITDEHKVAATITALKKLEGLLIFYVYKVNGRNVRATLTIAEIKNVFEDINEMTKIVKIAVPRYLLLKAYYFMIRSHKRTAMKLLLQAKRLSLKTENKMIYAWAEHCQKAWLGTMPSIQEDLWKERSGKKLTHKWDEINANNSRIIPFTLPLPKYIN